MLVLRLFQDGDPYFPREVLHAMKRGAKILNLSSFRDDSNSSPWDYTAFVRTFALYLDERLDCFLTGKLQRRYTNKDRDGSFVSNRGTGRRGTDPVRDMKPPMLLDKISFWQRLLERAIGTRPTGSAKTNRLVQICLYAVVQESFDLYKDISDGLALLLDSFFHLQYHSCVIAFQTCVKASKQFEELSAFYSLCKSIGVGRTSEYPSVQNISEELIETLQEFLKDQSSFPVRSPARALALPAGSSSGRDFSYDGKEYSYSESSTERYSEGVTEYGSQSTSLEDLISATESGRNLHNISIDLEDYSDQFEKKSQRDDAFRVSDTGSTHSLPASNSMVDLVSLDDWPANEEQDKKEEASSASGWELVLAEVASEWHHQSTLDFGTASTGSQPVQGGDKKEEESVKASSETSWELVLADSSMQWNQQIPDLFNNFDPLSANTSSQPVQEDKKEEAELSSAMGWELVLAETASQWTQQTPSASNTFDASSLDSLYNQPPNNFDASLLDSLYNQPSNNFGASSPDNVYNHSPVSLHHYNPFLQETTEIPAMPTTTTTSTYFEVAFPANTDMFSSAPTFQATPTFSTQNPNDTFGSQNENDPFGAFGSEQLLNGSMNQQNLLQEQQLWLQQQNKIIAKHMS